MCVQTVRQFSVPGLSGSGFLPLQEEGDIGKTLDDSLLQETYRNQLMKQPDPRAEARRS